MDKQLRIALAGNPNSGKTTLFNKLTGSNQFVGNWPGVTVEKKEGKLIVDKEVILTDLPGIYSLSKAGRDPEYRGRHESRTQPVPDHPAHRARHPRGHCAEHDGPGPQGRRQHQREGAEPPARLQGRGDLRAEGRRRQGGGAGRDRSGQERENDPAAQLLRACGACARPHRGGHRPRPARGAAALVRHQGVRAR